MVVTAKMYGKVFLAAFNKEIDLLDDVIICTLHSAAYVPDQDAHAYVNDLSNELPTAGGYTVGGKQLVNDTLTYTAATNTVMYDADDVVWPASTLMVRNVVLSDRTPPLATVQPLIAYQQSDVDVGSSGGDFRIEWNASGIFTIVVG